MPTVETSITQRQLVIPTQRAGVEALVPVLSSEKGIGIRRSLRTMFQEARRLQGTSDQLVGTIIDDVQVSAMKAPDQGGYYVMLEGLQDTGDDLVVRPRNDLLQQVAEQNQHIEQAVTMGNAVVQAPTVADAAQIIDTVLNVIPFSQGIPVPVGYRDPDIEQTRPFNYHVKYFDIVAEDTPEAYANALFSARTFSFPPNEEHPDGQQFGEIVRGIYKTEQGLIVSFFAQPPTEQGITMHVQLLKSRNPFLGRPLPMTPQEAGFVRNSLQTLKQTLERQ